MTEKKILIARGDSLPAIVEKILTEDSTRIMLTIPSGADIGVSVQNFHLLRREAEHAGKELMIESADDHILELASLAGIPSRNAFFHSKERAVSDIIARPASTRPLVGSASSRLQPSLDSTSRRGGRGGLNAQAVESAADRLTSDIERQEVEREESKLEIENSERSTKDTQPAAVPEPEPERPKRSPHWFRVLVISVCAAAVLGGGWWVATAVVPRATVTIRAARIPIPFMELIDASVRVTAPESTGTRIVLPAQSFDARRTLELTFPTAGTERVATKASGTLVVTNAFSSEPQVLVATTRFVSPEGTVFRLNQRSVIPGARVSGGTIQSSTTTVSVTADAAGEAHNVPASDGWRIPGFQGTPKYDTFTAAAPDALRGGFMGERAAPTKEEEARAVQSLDASLRDALVSELVLLTANEHFTELRDATRFVVLRRLRSSGDDSGTFRLFGEASLKQIVFDDRMFKEAVGARAVRAAAQQSSSLTVDSIDASFEVPTVDFDRGTLTVAASGTVALRYVLDSTALTTLILGKDETKLNSMLSDIPGISKATVHLWPFWVRRAPNDSRKITVVVE
ncbi:MAG: hypothetical protein Q7S84_02210 [bacterium]|nr:hypothetical protein [bacterium]